MISENASFVIMDVLVQTKKGFYINVEMQKLGYRFPVERADCYTSDLIMRQYSAVKKRKLQDGEKFRFEDLSPVVSVVIMEKSPKMFLKNKMYAIHKRYSTFDTKLKGGEGLSKNYFICLDIFQKYLHTETIRSKKEAWLLFFSGRTAEDVYEVCKNFPEFVSLYEEIFKFRGNLEEFMGVFSEALRIMDKNTERYMVEELQEENEKLQEENEKLQEENEKLQDRNEQLQKELEKLKKKLKEN